MLNYKDYEKKVYNWLQGKHQSDPSFTFSVRQNSSKGAESDYFIGTEKSKYFSTTFWYMPVSFPGSSGDCIGLQFYYTKTGYNYFFEFTQTMSPKGDQNIAALELVKAMQPELENLTGLQKQPKAIAKMFTIRTKTPKESYDTVEEMFIDIEKEMALILPVVDRKIEEIKNLYPSFEANRLTEDEFAIIMQKFEARMKRHEKYTDELLHDNPTKNSIKNLDKPLNQILYGPPGTGKTYHTILEAAKIITGYKAIGFDEALNVFNTNLHNQIEFITFHQNYSYEDFIQGLRPDTENGNALTFEKKDGVFKRISDRALFEYYIQIQKTKSSNSKDYLDINEVYLDFYNSLKIGQKFSTKTNKSISIIQLNKNKNIVFKYENGTKPVLVSAIRLINLHAQRPNINLIKNVNEDIRDAIGGCDATVYYTMLKEFISFYENAKTRIDNKEEYQDFDYSNITEERKNEILSQISLDELRKVKISKVKNYVIIIDEINRANISRVFGELITLIEEDKRSHGKIPMTVTLPSGDPFTVPSNLYIIGTMNTADKSIALLDIALRRRFEFVPMYPDITMVKPEYQDFFEKLNKSIKIRKGYDFTIGHAYFMDDRLTLDKIINNKVIPLLLEYLMNDENEVTKILKEAGITIEGWPLKLIS